VEWVRKICRRRLRRERKGLQGLELGGGSLVFHNQHVRQSS
jgi:hypothetical protein